MKNTSEIGFLDPHESSSASSIRRVEALTNDNAVEYLKLQNKTYRERIEYAFYNIIDEIQSMHETLGAASPFSNELALGLDTKLRKFKDIPEIPQNIVTDELKKEFADQLARFQSLETYLSN